MSPQVILAGDDGNDPLSSVAPVDYEGGRGRVAEDEPQRWQSQSQRNLRQQAPTRFDEIENIFEDIPADNHHAGKDDHLRNQGDRKAHLNLPADPSPPNPQKRAPPNPVIPEDDHEDHDDDGFWAAAKSPKKPSLSPPPKPRPQEISDEDPDRLGELDPGLQYFPRSRGDLPSAYIRVPSAPPSPASGRPAATPKKILSISEIHDTFAPDPNRRVLFAELQSTKKALVAKDIFGPVGSAGSVQGAHFEEDPLKYRVCRLRRVCFNSTHTLLPVADGWEKSWLDGVLEGCAANRAPAHAACSCLSGSRRHVTITPAEFASLRYHEGAHFVFDKYISGKHIGHWMETAGLLHSVLLNAEAYSMAALRSVLFLKDTLPLTDHESSMLAIATKSLGPTTRFQWADDLNEGGGSCFEETYSTTLTARVATNTNDATALRRRAFDHFGFDAASCPPKKAVILHRFGEKRRRAIQNEEEVERVLRNLGFIDVERATISHLNSSLEQALLFNQAGLVVAPHGSELVNAIFSQPKAALIEVVPSLFNYDFVQLGLDLATPLWFSVGGEVAGTPVPEVVQRCNQLFKNCVGEPRCCKNMEKKNPECGKAGQAGQGDGYLDYARAVKQLDFTADIKAFERVAREMVKKLNETCDGKWPGIRAKQV